MFDKRKLILAPQAGVTDVVFRQLCIEQGAQLTYTEMVSAKALSYGNEKTENLLVLAPNEPTVSVQIFGHEPKTMAEEARFLQDKLEDSLFAIDINMGCPAKKISSKGDGAALMKNPKLAYEIISEVSSAVSVPVTVKFRRGFENGHEIAPEFARMAEEAGASAVAVHGRFAQQFYRGNACWDTIARVKQAVSIPVIGNGDIVDGPSAKAMFEQTSCDAIMIGRATQGYPWIFREVSAYLSSGKIIEKPSAREKMDMAIRHAYLLSQSEGSSLVRMRKHAMWYLAGLPGASVYRRACNDAVKFADFRRIFEEAASYAAQVQEA